ncbi:2-amino-3-ketobutyrate coenzyme A ligase, mitochondrial, partial [Smittium culicis]
MMGAKSIGTKIPTVYANRILAELGGIKEAGTAKNERVIISSQEAEISVRAKNEKGEYVDSKVLNFCANNYLGLANNKQIVSKAKEYLESHGNGLSSVRFICGTQDIHKNLE